MAIVQDYIPPFAQMDRVGLDVIHDIFFELGKRTGDITATRAAAFVDKYVQRGELGTKTGKGFYRYPNPDWEAEHFLTGEPV